MFPFTFAPQIHWPLSGGVTQAIAPFGEIAGIPEVEHEIVTEVASYGTQLALLTDAVLALAEAVGVDGPEVAAVTDLRDGVEAAKRRVAGAVAARAEALAARAEALKR